MREEWERLRDVLEAIAPIEKYAVLGRGRFDRDELVQAWVVRHLQIIGEAVRSLSPEVRGRRPDVPWSTIVGLRHILVHHYFDIDIGTVWSIVEDDLPGFRHDVEALLADLDSPPGEPASDEQ